MPYDPLIINLAPTGMIPTKEMTPHVPVSVPEILEEVEACVALGATIIHLHARDERGAPTHRKDYFAPLVAGVRRIDPELVVCVTCSGRFATELAQRAEVLELEGAAKPDMASLTLGSNNFVQQASVNSPAIIKGLASRMLERGIKPELEVFEPGMLAFGSYLAQKGLLATPCYVNVLLGNLGTSPLSPGSLATFLSIMPAEWTWAVAGLGAYQLDANVMGIAAGGHVRVGVEDNIWFDRARTRLATNRALVERVRRIAELSERPIATPAQTRARLGLPAVTAATMKSSTTGPTTAAHRGAPAHAS